MRNNVTKRQSLNRSKRKKRPSSTNRMRGGGDNPEEIKKMWEELDEHLNATVLTLLPSHDGNRTYQLIKERYKRAFENAWAVGGVGPLAQYINEQDPPARLKAYTNRTDPPIKEKLHFEEGKSKVELTYNPQINLVTWDSVSSGNLGAKMSASVTKIENSALTHRETLRPSYPPYPAPFLPGLSASDPKYTTREEFQKAGLEAATGSRRERQLREVRLKTQGEPPPDEKALEDFQKKEWTIRFKPIITLSDDSTINGDDGTSRFVQDIDKMMWAKRHLPSNSPPDSKNFLKNHFPPWIFNIAEKGIGMGGMTANDTSAANSAAKK